MAISPTTANVSHGAGKLAGMSPPRRLPAVIPDDVEIVDVDLDQEEVIVGGERLTEARAEKLAEDILSRGR